jgi:DNA-binding NtrC family response regulator/predicted hydrocarbon binding protein
VRADDLKLQELIHFSDGLVDLQGRRLLIQDLRSQAQFRRELIESLGEAPARHILTRMGYFWGQADASAMQRVFVWENTAEWLKAGAKLHMLQGLAQTEIEILELDEGRGRVQLELRWRNSAEAEEVLSELGPATAPSCWMLAGYASGYASYCLKRDVYFVEDRCKACGAEFCLAVGKDRESWGREIAPQLVYFQATDIQAKIRSLGEQLRERTRELRRQRDELQDALRGPSLADVPVHSARFQQTLQTANRVARFDTTVLITGETGVGKEVLARHIHEQSPRAAGRFVAVNCGALPETLLGSELFGHKAGAFTGASHTKKGLFDEAVQGTIFLDEIGDVSPALQMRLLRVLQEKEILPIGETRSHKVDVRIVAATNRNLEKAVEAGEFREDLYYRLQVVKIDVPPLRERREDILALTRWFVRKCAKRLGLPELRLDATCVDCLLEYPWPGNVRELENALEHAAVLCADGVIRPESLPATISSQPVLPLASGPRRSLAEVELEYIQMVLKTTGGNRTEAAKILQIGQATLYRKLRSLK